MRLHVKQVHQLVGHIDVPRSKYHAHRALILASLADGTSSIAGACTAGHVRHTIDALRALGTTVETHRDGFVVHGGRYRPTRQEISVGSSGTTLYFLTGLASLATLPVTLVGQRYFDRRPIGPLLQALGELGVQVSSADGCPPIHVEPHRSSGGHVRIPGTLSQWISGLLLLAPFSSGRTVIEVDGPLNEQSYIDLTIRMMAQFGLHVDVREGGWRYEVEPGQEAHPADIHLPPDIGSAAFSLAATALHPSDVVFRGLPSLSSEDVDHPEGELLDVLQQLGLPVAHDPATGLVRVRHDGLRPRPVEVDCRRMPDMLPALSVVAAVADGTSVLHNVGHVRLKESDRVDAMLQLNAMGARLEIADERLLCHGVSKLRGADLSSFNDHRVLMALTLAATRASGSSSLTFPRAYRISYPRFLDDMNALGMDLSVSSRKSPAASPRGPVPVTTRTERKTVSELLRDHSIARPDDPAVVDRGLDDVCDRMFTRQDLDVQVDAAAAALLRLGVEPEETVAVQLPNVAEFVVVSLAVARIGAIVCPLMPIFRNRELRQILSRSRPRVVVVAGCFRGRQHAREVSELLATDPQLSVRHVVVVGPSDDEQWPPTVSGHRYAELTQQPHNPWAIAARDLAPDARFQLLFTSGTTGEPKGALHKIDVLSRAASTAADQLGLTAADRLFVPSPLAHQTGFLYGMWMAVQLGATQILQPIWDGQLALDLIRRHRATFVQAAVPFLADLVRAVEETGQRPESLRTFVATGAAVPRVLAQRATTVLGAAVCGAWGTTETCLGSLSTPYDDPGRAWGTDGRALPGVQLRVTTDGGHLLPAGAEGNLEVLTDSLFECYLDRPEATKAAVTADGWCRTGDLAILHDDGYVSITGRVHDVINRGGEKVPVAEVEQLLHAHPCVGDVAVVAMPDQRLGERACAFLVGTGGIDLSEVQRYLNDKEVAKQYWPERVEHVDALPRNATGKVQKFLLRERARALMDSKEQV